MSRKSAKYIAMELVGYAASDVYEIWKDMGLIIKNKYGDWTLTELGVQFGGKMSKNSLQSVPTFEANYIIDKMIEWYTVHRKQ